MKPRAKPSPPKQRLDVLLVERGLAESRPRAQALILAGQVRVNRERVSKAGAQIRVDAAVDVLGSGLPFASRGGLKLAGALDDFHIDPAGKICLDIGASTGGFTDCLLQRGAVRVYAVDVTTGQLAWKLRNDPRVVLVERNARYLTPADVAEPAALVVLDVSFISAAKVLPAVAELAAAGADLLILVKPQFELDRKDVGKGGIVRDPALHARAVARVRAAAAEAGLAVLGERPSQLPGTEGNQEFFLHLRKPP